MALSTIYISIPPYFSFSECHWFLNRNYIDSTHTIKAQTILKSVKIGNETFLLCIQEKNNLLEISILKGDISDTNKLIVKEFVMEWLDMNTPIQKFYAILNKDHTLSYMSEKYNGLRLIGIVDLFEALCWGVIGQQINLNFAYTLKKRLVEQWGDYVEVEGNKYYQFPSFEKIAMAKVSDLKEMQFSTRKAEYIIGIAKAFALGDLSKEKLKSMPDAESRRTCLLNIRGIGIWTANYVLMKSLKCPSAIPHGDAGLSKALINHGIITDRNDSATYNSFFAKYKGWESYLVLYLWRSLSEKPVI